MTAQRIEAAKPTKPKGSAEGESLFGKADAPTPLYQEGYSMTDTTDQQAATVAQEAMYLIRKGGYFYRPNAQGYTTSKAEAGRYTLADAIAHSHPNGPDGPRDGMDYMLADEPAASSLSFVSSASAEGFVLVPRKLDPAMASAGWSRITVGLTNGEQEAMERLWSALLDAAPKSEPVPATNQAGEVDHGLGPHAVVIEGQGFDTFMPVAALSGNLVYLKQGAAQITMDQPMWRDLTTALATQPATSQEALAAENAAYLSDVRWWREIAEGKGYDSITDALEAAPKPATSQEGEA